MPVIAVNGSVLSTPLGINTLLIGKEKNPIYMPLA